MKSRVSIASFSIAVAFWLGVLMAGGGGRVCGGVTGTAVERVEEAEELLRLLWVR